MKNLIILLLALAAIKGATAQWFTQNSGTTNNLYSVYFTDAITGYAVGNSGTILKTSDGGVNWIAQNSGTNISFHSVFFLDLMTGFCVGDSGTIIKTTNGGSNWNLYRIDSTYTLNSVYFSSESIGYAVGGKFTYLGPYSGVWNAIIYKTNDGGDNWNENFTTEGTLSSVCFPSIDIGYAAGGVPGTPGYGFFLKTIDGGENWSVSHPGGTGFGTIYFTNNDTGYAVSDGVMFKTKDGSENWTIGYVGEPWNLISVFFMSNGIGYGIKYNFNIMDGGLIYKTIDDGENWILQDSTMSAVPCALHFPCPDTGYIVGTNGIILKTINGGGPMGNYEQEQTTFLKICPNPTKNKILILSSELLGDTQLSIFYVSGEKVIEMQLTTTETQIDISALPWGVYFVRVQDVKRVETVKLMKQ